MKILLRYLRPSARSMSFGLTVKVLATLLELMLPYILSHILDTVVPRHSIPLIFLWGGVMLLCAFGAYLGNVIANRNAARVARDASRQMRHDLFDATMHLSARQTDKFTIPSLESRLTTDTYNVYSFISMMQRMGVRAPMLLLGGMVIAVGLLISSLTESQLIAALGTFAASLVMMLMDTLAYVFSGSELITAIIGFLSVSGRYSEFTVGVIGYDSVIFFLSMQALFLFLTVRILDRKRWS